MKTSLLASIAAAGLILSGCSVMHFQNGPVEPEGNAVSSWHHNVALSLIEVSKPVDLATGCAESNGKWSMVTTKETFGSGLVGAADNMVISALAGFGVDIWDPQSVEYTCGK